MSNATEFGMAEAIIHAQPYIAMKIVPDTQSSGPIF